MKEKFAGTDWASEAHAVCVVDEGGVPHRERAVAHTRLGSRRSASELVALGTERVAIERSDGILVDRLLKAGLTVLALHPNQANAARERYSVAHGKCDRFDAFVLAELARRRSRGRSQLGAAFTGATIALAKPFELEAIPLGSRRKGRLADLLAAVPNAAGRGAGSRRGC